MLSADVRDPEWILNIPGNRNAIIVMEGVSMYLHPDELKRLLSRIGHYFPEIRILMDCYSTFAVKMSSIRNPIHDVGGAAVYGADDPRLLEEDTGLSFVKEHEMTPQVLINELQGIEKAVFRIVYPSPIACAPAVRFGGHLLSGLAGGPALPRLSS